MLILLAGTLFGSQVSAQDMRLRLGALDSPPEQVFGRIIDVAMGPRGDVFVLDGLTHELRWFGADGELRGMAGGEGEGPGELGAPLAVALDQTGRLNVLDPKNLRISEYTPTEAGLLFTGDARTLLARDICIAGPRRYLLMYARVAEGQLIWEIGESGQRLSAFFLPPSEPETLAEFPRAEWTGLRDRLAYGVLGCSLEAATLVFLHEIRPLVVAFTLEGEELWRTQLEDYHAMALQKGRRRGSVAMLPDPATQTTHAGSGVAIVGDEVRVTLHERGLGDPEGTLEVRILRLSDGAEVSRESTTMVWINGGGGYLVGYTQFPFPWLEVRRVSR